MQKIFLNETFDTEIDIRIKYLKSVVFQIHNSSIKGQVG